MNRYTVLFVSTLLLRCIAGAVQLLAQSQGPFPPDSPDCRYLDDYRYLDSLEERNFYECLKYCPVGRRSSFSFGGESRFLYLNFSHYQLTDKQEDPNGYVLQRYLLHGDFRYGNWFRVFSQFQYTDSHWRTGGSLLIDHDALELHQLFIGLSADFGGSILQLNMGRREYSFGNQRWLSAREGPNTRISFDGLNLKLRSGFVLDFFLLAPVALGPESFDARADWNQKRIGFHFNKASRSQDHELNLYGLWFETITSRPNSGAIPRKAALGLRDVLTGKSYEIDAEIMLQFARVRGRLMHAYLAGINASYLPPLAKERFTLGLDALYTSGRGGENRMTYQSLHPAHKNIRKVIHFGRHNMCYIMPYLGLKAGEKNDFRFETNVYLRPSLEDHVYNIPGFIVFDAADFNGHFLGTQYALVYKRRWNPWIATTVCYTYFLGSEATKAVADNPYEDLFFIQLSCRF